MSSTRGSSRTIRSYSSTVKRYTAGDAEGSGWDVGGVGAIMDMQLAPSPQDPVHEDIRPSDPSGWRARDADVPSIPRLGQVGEPSLAAPRHGDLGEWQRLATNWAICALMPGPTLFGDR